MGGESVCESHDAEHVAGRSGASAQSGRQGVSVDDLAAAPGFEISPAREEQKIALKAGGAGSLSWIVSPHRTGTFQIAVSDILNTQILGVTVKDENGLTATQAKLLALVGSLSARC